MAKIVYIQSHYYTLKTILLSVPFGVKNNAWEGIKWQK